MLLNKHVLTQMSVKIITMEINQLIDVKDAMLVVINVQDLIQISASHVILIYFFILIHV